MKALIYSGVILVVIGILFSIVNYVFHMPAYRPEWFDMQSMMRLIELNLIFTALGIILIMYKILR